VAEFHDYVTYGQMMAVVERLDERISGLAQEVRGLSADISELRTVLREDSGQMRADMAAMGATLRDEMREMRADIRGNVTEMRADIRHLSGRLFTLHLALWGVVGVGFTLYKLFPNT